MAKQVIEQHTHEVKIYVETAYEILTECFKKSGTAAGDRNAYKILSDAMADKFDGDSLDVPYLRNLFNKIKKAREEDTGGDLFTIYHQNIVLLKNYADVGDLYEYDASFAPGRSIPLLFTKTPFRKFTIIRVPAQGKLAKGKKSWTFSTDKGEIFSAALSLSARPFTMSGDSRPYWIEVSFSAAGEDPQQLYFSTVPVPSSPVTPEHPLLHYFEQIIKINNAFRK